MKRNCVKGAALLCLIGLFLTLAACGGQVAEAPPPNESAPNEPLASFEVPEPSPVTPESAAVEEDTEQGISLFSLGPPEPSATPEPSPSPSPIPSATPKPSPTPTPAPTPTPVPTPTPEPKTATAADAQAYIGRGVSSLYKAIGYPPYGSSYASSCLGDGEDGELYYIGFTVYTYRENGVETVQNVF